MPRRGGVETGQAQVDGEGLQVAQFSGDQFNVPFGFLVRTVVH